MMVFRLLAWYAVAVSLEATATGWVRRKRWIAAVCAVNLVTYPVFFMLTPTLLDIPYAVPLAELVIAVIEGTALCAIYGFRSWRALYAAAFVMNAFSYGVSLLMRVG